MPENPRKELSRIFVERMDERLAALGKSRYWLSKEISGGRQTGIFNGIETKGTVPGSDRLRLIADALDTTTDYLVGVVTSPQAISSEVEILPDTVVSARNRPAPTEPGIPLLGTGDCADLELTDAIHIERSSFDSDYHVRMIERPPALRGARHAYAIYFQGSSMEPRFYAGEIGIVDPDRPAAPGDFVLVQMNNGAEDDVVSVLVKRLVRQTSQYVELEQFNPQTVFQLPKRQVARIHKIIPPTDLLFR